MKYKFLKKEKKKVIFPSHEKACNFNEMVLFYFIKNIPTFF